MIATIHAASMRSCRILRTYCCFLWCAELCNSVNSCWWWSRSILYKKPVSAVWISRSSAFSSIDFLKLILNKSIVRSPDFQKSAPWKHTCHSIGMSNTVQCVTPIVCPHVLSSRVLLIDHTWFRSAQPSVSSRSASTEQLLNPNINSCEIQNWHLNNEEVHSRNLHSTHCSDY